MEKTKEKNSILWRLRRCFMSTDSLMKEYETIIKRCYKKHDPKRAFLEGLLEADTKIDEKFVFDRYIDSFRGKKALEIGLRCLKLKGVTFSSYYDGDHFNANTVIKHYETFFKVYRPYFKAYSDLHDIHVINVEHIVSELKRLAGYYVNQAAGHETFKKEILAAGKTLLEHCDIENYQEAKAVARQIGHYKQSLLEVFLCDLQDSLQSVENILYHLREKDEKIQKRKAATKRLRDEVTALKKTVKAQGAAIYAMRKEYDALKKGSLQESVATTILLNMLMDEVDFSQTIDAKDYQTYGKIIHTIHMQDGLHRCEYQKNIHRLEHILAGFETLKGYSSQWKKKYYAFFSEVPESSPIRKYIFECLSQETQEQVEAA